MKAFYLPILSLLFPCIISAQYSFEWAVACKGGFATQGKRIAVDQWGNVYRQVNLSGTVDLDPGPAIYNLSSAGSTDVAVVKLDSSGAFVWAKRFGGTGSENCRSIAVDSNGFVYTTGLYKGTVDFDPGSGSYPLTASLTEDNFYVSKLDSGGNFVWARGVTTGSVTTTDIAIDDIGNVYLTGDFSDTVDFDPGPGQTWETNSTFAAGFLLKLDNGGNFVWVRKFASSPYNNGGVLPSSVAVSSSRVAIGGSFSDTVDFNPGVGSYSVVAPMAGGVFYLSVRYRR